MARGTRSGHNAVAPVLRAPRAAGAPSWAALDGELDAIRGGDWQSAARCLNGASGASAGAVLVAIADAVQGTVYGKAYEMCAQAHDGVRGDFAGRHAELVRRVTRQDWTADTLMVHAQNAGLSLAQEEAAALALTPLQSLERTIGPEDAGKLVRARSAASVHERYRQVSAWVTALVRLIDKLEDGHTGQCAWLLALSQGRSRPRP